MRLVNTVVRYESSTRTWLRLLEIAADHFPDTLADLAFLRTRGVKLELHVDDDRASYLVKLVGPDVLVVEADRKAQGRTPLSQPLAALAEDSQEHMDAGHERRLVSSPGPSERIPRKGSAATRPPGGGCRRPDGLGGRCGYGRRLRSSRPWCPSCLLQEPPSPARTTPPRVPLASSSQCATPRGCGPRQHAARQQRQASLRLFDGVVGGRPRVEAPEAARGVSLTEGPSGHVLS